MSLNTEQFKLMLPIANDSLDQQGHRDKQDVRTAKEVYAAAGTSLSRCLSLSQGIEVPFPLHYFIRLR